MAPEVPAEWPSAAMPVLILSGLPDEKGLGELGERLRQRTPSASEMG